MRSISRSTSRWNKSVWSPNTGLKAHVMRLILRTQPRSDSSQPLRLHLSRGRNTGYPVPPSQIPAGGFPAPGSSDQLALASSHPRSQPETETDQPLTDTQFGLLRHTCVRFFHNARFRHLESRQQPFHRWPCQTRSLTTPVQPFIDCPARFLIEQLHSAIIADDPIVIPCALELGFECFH